MACPGASTAVVIASAPSDEVHQLDRIPFRYGHTREAGASHDRAVMLHHHGAGIELERRQELEQRGARGYRTRLTVDCDVDGTAHPVNGEPRTVAAGATLLELL